MDVKVICNDEAIIQSPCQEVLNQPDLVANRYLWKKYFHVKGNGSGRDSTGPVPLDMEILPLLTFISNKNYIN